MYECETCGAPAVVTLDNPELGEERSAYQVDCSECGWTAFVPAEATARSRIAKLRYIAKEHHAQRVDGYIVDATTANLLVTIYNKLSPQNREKFGKPSLPRLVDFAWKVAR